MRHSGKMHAFPLFYSGLVHLRCSTLERDLGVDWHGLAMKLPQNYPKILLEIWGISQRVLAYFADVSPCHR